MRSLPWLLLLLPQVPGQAARERPPLERPGLLELSLPERGGVRAEHFQLSLPGAPGEPVGAARLLRVEDQEERRLEWETRFFDAPVRVLHSERLEPDSLDLVWRELGEGGGRTVRVAFDQSSNALAVNDVGGPAARHRELELGEGAFAPLFLLEQDRAGRLSPGDFRRVDANAGALESVHLASGPAPAPWLAGCRISTWTRPDGTLAGRYLFHGDRLLAFQLQEGGPVATAVGPAEYEALLARAGARLPR
jgi:hypothetical protein